LKIQKNWRGALEIYKHPRIVGMFFFGFAAGLPLALLVLGTLSFWLREAGIDRTTIGYFSWIGLAYAFKWAWSPLVDRMPLPLLTRVLGRRRAWLFLSQITLAATFALLAMSDPQTHLSQVVWLALIAAFASATQDIALDAYRIEAVETDLQAGMAASYQGGYRIAMLTATAGALAIAAWFDPDEASYQHYPWLVAYMVMATLMGVGIITTLLTPEPIVNQNFSANIDAAELNKTKNRHPKMPLPFLKVSLWLKKAVIAPFADFIAKYKWHAILILALISTYRISDIVLGVMANPFYVDMGFSKAEVASITKVFGVIMTLTGAALGGVLSARFGMMPTLFLGALLTATTNTLFAVLANVGHNIYMLAAVIGADNLSAGIASTAFIAYLSSLTNVSYSATQYALFSSIMLLLPKFIAGFSGVYVDNFGYTSFFLGAAALGLPVLFLIYLANKHLE